jgi:hypothetical protein
VRTKRKAGKLDGRTKQARQLKEHAAHMDRLKASLTRLQDPDYVVKVIQECQRRGLIPSEPSD